LFRTFLEALPDACLVIDRFGNVLAVNAEWNNIVRQSEVSSILANNPVGANYLSLCRSTSTKEGLEQVRQGIESVLNGDSQQYEREYLSHTLNGIRWYRKIVRPWRQYGAEAIILHREITAEKLAKTSPQTLDAEFRVLANASPVLIWMSGPDEACTFFNREWVEFTGVPLEEQLGSGWLKLVHPDDRERMSQTYHAAWDQRHVFEFEYRLRHRDGEYRWVRDRGLPRFDAQNQVTGYIGSAWDLSDQKQAIEAAYKASRQTRLEHMVAVIANSATTVREALQHSIDVICQTMAFPVGHALVIYDDEPELAKPAHILHCKDLERFAALFEVSQITSFDPQLGVPGIVLRSGKPVIHDMSPEYTDPKLFPRAKATSEAGLRAGIHLPVLVENKVESILEFGSDYPVASDQELISTLLAACERLSRFFERRRAQIMFLKQKEELEASAQQLFALAGRVVDSQEEERRKIARELHDDFSQRLAIVNMKITRLAGQDRALSAGELNADLEDVRESISSVAEDLHGLSRQLHPARLELLGLVRALRAQCSDVERGCGIEIEFRATASNEDASPPAATCLYRVLQEALMNIAKHSGSSIARVTLMRYGEELEMRVGDEGQGFIAGKETVKGIGLTNMEERVRLLNGKLIVNSTPGRGTEVVVKIPAVVRVQQGQSQD
jgi:PAS domain S-box-containing protein